MEQHLRGRGTSFMEFNKSYANQLRLEVADHVRTGQRQLKVTGDDYQISGGLG